MDIILAIILILILSPVLLITYFIILFTMGRPVFYIQKRPGYKSKIFNIIKFRTMRKLSVNDDSKDIFRITRVGNFLRISSIDELPSLVNILRGEMSFIGPRPLLEEYLPLYSNRQIRRHDLLPGITGLAQVNGRNTISWSERFDLDLQYIEQICFLLDIKILVKTFLKVLLKEGINSSTSITMPPFKGDFDSELDKKTGV